MLARLTAAALAAVLASPSPAPTPLKTISHLRVLRLCTGLRRSIYPAVGRVLQDDKVIAQSRPLFQDYVKQSATSTQPAVDLDVVRLERLIDPLVKNTQAIERLLNDPIYPLHAVSQSDQDLLDMRTRLQEVLAQQKRALDLVSGFVDTQQMGELQNAGHEYDSATAPNRQSSPPPSAPTSPPNDILSAGIPNPQRSNDPRFTPTNSLVGYNPLNGFDEQMEAYQQTITTSEDAASKIILKVVPECGGHVP
jgi:hypothetical protein